MVLSCKIKAHCSVAQHSLCLPKKHSQAPILGFLLKIRNVSQLHEQSLAKKSFLYGHKYIYKRQYFLLAEFLNDDFNLFSDFSYAEKKLAQQRSGCIEVCTSLFMCRNTSKGFKGFNNGTMTA